MITLCMFMLMLPLQMAAADSAEDAAKGATDATGLYDQAVALLEAEEYEAALLLLEEAAEQGIPEAITALVICIQWASEQSRIMKKC